MCGGTKEPETQEPEKLGVEQARASSCGFTEVGAEGVAGVGLALSCWKQANKGKGYLQLYVTREPSGQTTPLNSCC